jgi:putative DNA-invertase from lambdoid prophage Rac
VTGLDQLGRDVMEVLATVEQLETFGVPVHCLALGGVDLASAAGKITIQVINVIVEFKHDQFIKRTTSGIKRASAEGGKVCRPFTVTNAEESDVLCLLAKACTLCS